MKNLLSRIWTGIVGGVAGTCLGFAVSLLLLMAKFPLETSLWSVAILGGLGAVLGFAFGNKKLGGK